MATTQLARAIRPDFVPTNKADDSRPVEHARQWKPRMSWVVVTDSNGRRLLKMAWT
jgi:hypothetical protein